MRPARTLWLVEKISATWTGAGPFFKNLLDKIIIYAKMAALRIESRKSGTDKTRSFVFKEAPGRGRVPAHKIF